MSIAIWPSELRFKRGAQQLVVTFDDGAAYELPYKFLRENSPSAEVRGHGSGPKPPQKPISDAISVDKTEPVGRYAIRIFFSDGHSSGLYTWGYLRELGERLNA